MFLSWQKKLGGRYALTRAGNEAAGITGNCFIVLGDAPNVKTLRIVFPALDGEDTEFIENLLREVKVKKFVWGEQEITVSFYEFIIPYSPDKIASVIDSITGYFGEKYAQLGQSCHNCGSEAACDVYTGESAQYLCENCFAGKEQAFSAAREEYERSPGNYASGFLGALLFTLPGVALAIVLFVFFDTIAAVSTLVCMILAQKGYKQFRGKISPAGALIGSAAGVIMTVAGIFAGYAASIIKYLLEEGATMDMIFPVLGEIMLIPELMKELTKNILVALAISAVYIVLNLYRMVTEWTFPLIKKAEAL